MDHKKKKQVMVRMDEKEYQVLKEKVAESGYNQQTYIINQLCNDQEPVSKSKENFQRVSQQLDELTYQLSQGKLDLCNLIIKYDKELDYKQGEQFMRIMDGYEELYEEIQANWRVIRLNANAVSSNLYTIKERGTS